MFFSSSPGLHAGQSAASADGGPGQAPVHLGRPEVAGQQQLASVLRPQAGGQQEAAAVPGGDLGHRIKASAATKKERKNLPLKRQVVFLFRCESS